jgi:hypothetical protein
MPSLLIDLVLHACLAGGSVGCFEQCLQVSQAPRSKQTLEPAKALGGLSSEHGLALLWDWMILQYALSNPRPEVAVM